MKNWNGWVVWLILCGLLLGAVALFSGAVIIHNPEHYNADSLRMALALTLGLEIVLTIVGILFEIFNDD